MKNKHLIFGLVISSLLLILFLYFSSSYQPLYAAEEQTNSKNVTDQKHDNQGKDGDQKKHNDDDHDHHKHKHKEHSDDDTITITTYEPVDKVLPASAMLEQPYDLVIGKKNAPVTIIEYSSLACPHCATFHQIIYPRIKVNFIDTGIVRYVYRDFPTNPASVAASMMAICSGDKRETLLNAFFETQSLWSYTPNFRQSLANIAALGSVEGIDKCMSDQSLQEQILRKAYIASTDYGVTATPMFFINGHSSGVINSYDEWATILKDAQTNASGQQ